MEVCERIGTSGVRAMQDDGRGEPLDSDVRAVGRLEWPLWL